VYSRYNAYGHLITHIRLLHSKQALALAYVPSVSMRANVLTKILPKSQYIRERDVLMNAMSV
jgi:hypothetical protein